MYALKKRLGFVESWLEEDRDRLFLWIPVFFGVGIGLYFSLTFEPDVMWGAGALMFASLAAFFARKKGILVWSLALSITLMSVGFLTATLRTISLQGPMTNYPLKKQRIEGALEKIESFAAKTRLTFSSVVAANLPKEKTPVKVRLTWRHKKGTESTTLPEIGDLVSFEAVLLPPTGPIIPGGYHFRQRAYFQQIGATGFITSPPEILKKRAEKGAWFTLQRFRQTINQELRELIPGIPGAIAVALVTGDRSGIDPTLRDSFAHSGIAHILAISGLHMSLVAGFFFFLIRGGLCLFPAIALRHPIKKWAAAATLVGSAAYLSLCFESVSAQRSFVMIAFMMLAILRDRTALSLRNVALAALTILILTPEALMNAGFQMSFAAVIALIAFYEVLRQKDFFTQRFERGLVYKGFFYGVGILITSLIASLATSPFTLFTFQKTSTYGLLTNLGAIPLASFAIMPLLMATVFLMPFGMGSLTASALTRALEVLIYSAETVSGWGNAVVYTQAMPTGVLLTMVAGGLWLCLWRQKARLFGIALVPLALIAWHFSPQTVMYAEGRATHLGIAYDGILYTTSKRSKGFIPEMWQRHSGRLELCSLHKSDCFDTIEGGYSTTLQGKKILLMIDKKAKHPRSLCDQADLILTLGDLRCRVDEKVINGYKLRRFGAHSVALTNSGDLSVTSQKSLEGLRPWS